LILADRIDRDAINNTVLDLFNIPFESNELLSSIVTGIEWIELREESAPQEDKETLELILELNNSLAEHIISTNKVSINLALNIYEALLNNENDVKTKLEAVDKFLLDFEDLNSKAGIEMDTFYMNIISHLNELTDE